MYKEGNKTSNKCRTKVTTLLVLILAIIFVTGCNQINKQKPVVKTNFMLDTVLTIQAYGDSATEAIDEAFERINDIERKMTVRGEVSEVISLNESSGDRFYKVSPDTFFVIKKGIEHSKKSQGRFDITIGPLVQLWGIGTENAKVPLKEEVIEKLSLVNYNYIYLDEEQKSVKLEKPGMSIDLGGIAKGYAADEVALILKKYDIKSSIIDLGGNIYVIGSKPDGNPWTIGLQDPFDTRGSIFATVEVVDKTLVTSGPYERFIEKDGKKYHHILDTSTGFPVENTLIGITVIGDSSIDADAISTTAYSLGLKEGLQYVENIENTDAIFVTKDYQVYKTSGIINYNFQLTKDKFTVEE